MEAEQSPFFLGWWGISLSNVGLGEKRPDVGTYGLYDQSNLPPLPVPLNGNFSWLRDARKHALHIGIERQAENERSLSELVKDCTNRNVALPHSFVEFISTPKLYACVRSNTDCFIDVAARPVRSPAGNGVLIRFLADSQGCIFWYLFIPTDSDDHAVVASPNFYGPEAEHENREISDGPESTVFAERSFEGFICRFWIENELWFSDYEATPINQIGRRYLAAYQTNA